MASIVNIAAYKFVALDQVSERRASLKKLTSDLALKGTILLSHEGINMFLAGSRESIDRYLTFIRNSSPALQDLAVKESLTDYQPFSRMVVKLKREIIPVGVGGELEVRLPQGVEKVQPIADASPKLAPRELKRWLDEGKDVALLDTRNDYEVDLGTFEDAIDLRLRNFRQFPEAAASLPEDIKEKPVVMFCTGGIRCEKIGPYMKGLGFKNIYQLEGGILKYFEECEQSHYRGDCFVFDQRVAVGPKLTPSDAYECYACKHVLTAEETKSPLYVPAVSCQYCYQTEQQKRDARQEKISSIAREQRGSTPYENKRWVTIPQKVAGKPVLDALCEAYPGFGRDAWSKTIQDGNLQYPRQQFQPVALSHTAMEGDRFLQIMPGYVEPTVSDAITLLHEEDTFLVVNKGAPLPVHPSGRFNRNTLIEVLLAAYHPDKLRPCHRLDMNTTGIVVVARRMKIANAIQAQFANGSVDKEYLLEVDGNVSWETMSCDAPIAKAPLPNGGRQSHPEGQPSLTHFRVLERFASTTILHAKPVTGRTHQIRLHTAILGHPILNDPIYLAGGSSRPQPDERLASAPLALHAWKIALHHPVSNEYVSWTAPWERYTTQR